MFTTILSIWLLLVLVLSFIKIKWGVALYLAYVILVPVMKLELGPLHLGENVFPFGFLVGYIFYANLNHVKTDWRPLLPFIFYFVATLCIMPLQSEVPFDVMFNSWRLDIMRSLFLPFAMWNVMKSDSSSIKLFRNTVLCSIIIAVAYGLFLTTLTGLNPYIMLFMDELGTEMDLESYYEDAGSGRLFGRISSVFVHPMSFALFLGLSFIYVFYCRKSINKYICGIVLLALGIMSILCGVRSVLGALAIVIGYYFLKARNSKMMFYIVAIGVVVAMIISTIPELSVYISSIADVNNSNDTIRGSSFDMRLDQLGGALKEGSRNPIFGLGYGWSEYYKSLHGDHPILLAFESLIYVIICNFGLAGFFIWGGLIVRYLQNNRKMSVKENVVFDGLLIFYVTYSCITGEYGYMKSFIIFYLLLLGESIARNANAIKMKR